jgi:hypothetical protein
MLGHILRLRIIANIAYFGLFVLFAAFLTRRFSWAGAVTALRSQFLL